MKRYYMSASNGSVVPHESPDGTWIKAEEVLCECCGIKPKADGNRYLCSSCFKKNGDTIDRHNNHRAQFCEKCYDTLKKEANNEIKIRIC